MAQHIVDKINKFKTFKFERQLKKDKENILKNIENKILFRDKTFPISVLNECEEFIEMVNGLNIQPTKTDKFPYLKDLSKLQEGGVIDLSKYKLSKTNPWYLKNLENGINNKDKKQLKEALNTPLKQKAIKILATISTPKEILANNYPISKDIILNNKDSSLLKELINNSNLSNKEYIEIAKSFYQSTTNPDILFELFKNKLYAYVYLLIQYEMIDKAQEIVKENDIKLFEYYLLLRNNKIKININEYLDVTL